MTLYQHDTSRALHEGTQGNAPADRLLWLGPSVQGTLLALGAAVILLASGASGWGAPVPMQSKPAAKAKPMQVEAGQWMLKWGGMVEPMPLRADGRYGWGKEWSGSFGWNEKTRVLLVSESTDGKHFICWWATLDKNGKGVTEGGFSGVAVHVYREKAEKLKAPKGED